MLRMAISITTCQDAWNRDIPGLLHAAGTIDHSGP